MTNNEVLLDVSGLSLELSDSDGNYFKVVDNISFKIEKGKSFGLVGESGSGKTVTALSILQLLSYKTSRVISGKIMFNHPEKGMINLLDLAKSEFRKIRGRYIGMIFQEPMTSLNPVKKVGWQVSEILIRHGVLNSSDSKKRVLKLFEEVKLPSPERIYKSYPHQLSGGQRQRAMIAMAMACNPSLLIADEPTTALDVTIQKSILDLINELKDSHKMSLLFISHDLGVVKEISDNVAVMYRGKIVESKSINAIFDNPSHPYTKGLIACRPPSDGKPARLPVIKHDDLIADSNNIYIEKYENVKSKKFDIKKIYKTDPLIQIKELSTQYSLKKSLMGKVTHSFTAVNKVSFDIYPGETVGLVGESGCGKTTLGRTILKLIDSSGGKVIFKGKDISKLKSSEMRKIRKRIQIIFQDPYSSLTPGISVGKLIIEPMRVHGICKNEKMRKQKVLELLKNVGLEEKMFHRYPHQLSGGQRQRVCIARALALNPELIICDESVSALDVSVQAQVLNLLNELKEKFNLTYLFISHDLSVVRYMSDRVMIMQNGEIIEEGEADNLFKNPTHPYTKKLIDAII